MAKKWTKAEREAASIAGKKRWAARKLSNTTAKYALPMTAGKNDQRLDLAMDVVDLIAKGDNRIRLIVNVVERILRP